MLSSLPDRAHDAVVIKGLDIPGSFQGFAASPCSLCGIVSLEASCTELVISSSTCSIVSGCGSLESIKSSLAPYEAWMDGSPRVGLEGFCGPLSAFREDSLSSWKTCIHNDSTMMGFKRVAPHRVGPAVIGRALDKPFSSHSLSWNGTSISVHQILLQRWC